MNIEVRDDGNIHVDGVWLADVESDTAWMRAEAQRFLAVADFLDARCDPADKYAAEKWY